MSLLLIFSTLAVVNEAANSRAAERVKVQEQERGIEMGGLISSHLTDGVFKLRRRGGHDGVLPRKKYFIFGSSGFDSILVFTTGQAPVVHVDVSQLTHLWKHLRYPLKPSFVDFSTRGASVAAS